MLRAQSRLWGRSEKSISLSDQPERTCVARGARLRIPANLKPSQVSQLEKFTTSSLSSEQEKWDFLKHSLSRIFTELRPWKTERGIISRKDGETDGGFRGGESLLCCHIPPCKFISVFYLELTERSTYMDTVMTHVRSDLTPDMRSSS